MSKTKPQAWYHHPKTKRLLSFAKSLLFLTMTIVVPLGIIAYRQFQEIYPTWDVPTVVTNIATQPQVKTVSPLHTSGRDILDSNNQKIILRGVNVGSVEWAEPSWHPKAINFLANNWPINIIRIRVLEKDYVADKDTFFRNLDWQFIRPAEENGLYIIISVKVRDASTDLADPPVHAMWQDLAARYKNDPHIIYDLLPEPHDVPMSRIVANYTALIDEVRALAPDSLIFVSGDNWGRNLNYYAQNPYPYPNIVYRTNPYNEAYFFPDQFEEIMSVYPVFLGEFGPTDHPFMSSEAADTLLKIAKDNDLSWTAWNFHSVGCPCLLSDWQTFTPSPFGEMVLRYLRP